MFFQVAKITNSPEGISDGKLGCCLDSLGHRNCLTSFERSFCDGFQYAGGIGDGLQSNAGMSVLSLP